MDQLASDAAKLSGVGSFRFRVWGRFAATRLADGTDVTPRGRKARALLAFLLIENRPVARDQLAGLLWSERGQAQAHASLRQSLTELRELAPTLRVERYCLTLERPASDLAAMFGAAGEGDAATLAAELSRGTGLLEDLDGTDPSFDEWLRAIRTTRGGALIAAAQACCHKAIGKGAIEPAEMLARTLLAIDPLDEGIARLAMEAAHSAGKQDAVQRIHDQFETNLRAELGVAPSAETGALHDRLIADARTPPGQAKAPQAESAAVALESSPTVRGSPGPRRRRWWIAAAAALVMLVTAGLLVVPQWLDPPAAEPVSLAVLPFRNLSSGDEHFAEGVAEEILAQLAREPQFRVAGRTSSWLFKDRAADLRDVGQRLDVDYVLEGSVRRAGERVRVDVALVGTRDGMRLWTHAFQGRLDDIFMIQNEIGLGVAASLRRRLVRAAPAAGPRRTTGEVYNLYLTARRLIRTRDPHNARSAIYLLRRAVRLDPNYAPAWSSLGEALRFEYGNRTDEARRYIERALALAPDLAEAHAALGLIEGSTRRARAHLEQAAQLDPNNAEAWLWLSNARYQALDFEGALAAMRRAAEIDPLWARTSQVANAAWTLGYREEALRQDRRIVATHPDPSHREMARGRIASRSGDWSGFVLHHLRAAEMNSDTRFEARLQANQGLIMLHLPWDETQFANSRQWSLFASLAKGRLPPLAEFLDRLGSADEYWSSDLVSPMASRAFINQGRAAELLQLYDRAFDSPAEMMQPDARLDMAIDQAPLVAIALREAGRHTEAEQLIDLASRRLAPACRRDHLAADIWIHCARIWALRGNREAALGALDHAAAMHWPHGWDIYPFWMPRPDLAGEPAFHSLRDEPRFQRLDARIRARLARERRELEAALAARNA